MNNVFVFVVCGTREHIDTLHFSLEYLKHFSRNEIYVVTDNSRNELPIRHPVIFDIKTPEYLNHHQASIYLKTGLHRFLPEGNTYCYLDTDVIALNPECDAIFDQLISPIRFAADYSVLNEFSPYAINCNCYKDVEPAREILREGLKKYREKENYNRQYKEKIEQLEQEFQRIQASQLLKRIFAVKFLLLKKIRVSPDFYYDKKDKAWKHTSGTPVMYEIDMKSLERQTGFSYLQEKDMWINQAGEPVWNIKCDHLTENIHTTFGIEIGEKNWQHWNGGVFLFDDTSHDFLESWHRKTMHIFTLPEWKTRDQGTLIATAWEFGLQDHPVLDKKWNFLADSNNPELDVNEDGFFTENNWESRYKVNFAHIYHRFGDTSWDLWNIATKKHWHEH